MLTQEQQTLAKGFFDLGFSDVAITKKLHLPPKSIYVFQFRKGLGIKAKTVLQKRHQAFLDLANEGVSDKQIAAIYGAKFRSVYVTLCSYGFRRKEQKNTIKTITNVTGLKAAKKVPSKTAPIKSVKPTPVVKKVAKAKSKTVAKRKA